MPGNLIVGLAITVIVIGFLILAGVAFWLAIERRRARSAASSRPKQQLDHQPAAQPHQPASPEPATHGQQAAQIVSPAALTGTEQPKDVHPSGEYPSAATYDQTILPTPPKRRTRPQSK